MFNPEIQSGVALRLPPHSKKRLSRYGPLIIWAALIFIGSGNVLSAANTSIVVRVAHWLFPQASDATLATLHFVIRKGGHLTEYALLALLTARAFLTSSRELLRSRWFWCALLVVVVYALSDEFHQSFVPSRTASIYDSMIDSGGGLVGLLVYRATRSRRGASQTVRKGSH